ncbi:MULTISPECIES: APH(3')-II family aminoglycoside O-phosphotransferase [Phyllobacteriaceae]|jgi:aminoglycoside 3'-phosphotransferase II|uniref:Aminoglycoside 3'-phosphotransferase n=1 Tax=Mesorhizobium hungaricum TaxID=1566387 RepID=A0A1C2ECT9_9HYPH|nr:MULTISPECIES: APH(3') family aminoglycoside O-phosphotransferase [Mesorhizobium]MBN9237534.1 aminoglycoside 3'-phosphotransferase [Mesorhizobium sp.]MDQ0329062.1 aminoglycoside 3'-phosphotransferase-2 [Mesorhizobium sp. YL-MeA3-2017]OCX24776.1 APH(3') family aminoglycoside O-phosphotransferase [Mesorhizobium hungaricum]
MTAHASPELDLPPAIRAMIAGYAWDRDTLGHSDAGVFRLEATDRPRLFLKVEESGGHAELPAEVERLRWLAGQGVACPEVLAFETHAGRDWLLMSAMPGRDLVSAGPLSAEKAIAVMAGALRNLHALDIRSCPFDHRLEHRIADARAHLEAGLVDEEDFDDERMGRTADDVFGDVIALRPSSEDLVVTHGDACLPNFMVDGDRFSGFIDCGRLGVADRCQDLALACWSIHHNLGPQWVDPFLAHYGAPDIDSGKLAYYRLLDEFF